MPKIRLLDKHTAELIAAGEVVERPASAAKELIENAIDAGATQVTVEITGGGVTCLRVTDNGCGIAREDVETAFLRHATSKIAAPEDLDGVQTLGFRGEALASIAAVAHVELVTRTAQELAGTRYTIRGGEAGEIEDIGCPPGTTIFVRDLFYNVPARMKFLKKDVSEGNAVAGVVDQIALSHPEVAFSFIREGRQELNTPGDGTVLSAVCAVCSREFFKQTIPVDYTQGGIRVTGVISRPSAARSNRVMQYFYVNGRFVKSKTAAAALEQGFKNSLMSGKFPACVLYLQMPAEVVDVNVHPAKIEVRFSNEKPVFDAVYYAVRSALTAGDAPKNAPLQPVAPPMPPTPPVPPISPISPMPPVPPAPPVPPMPPVPDKPAAVTAGVPRPAPITFAAPSDPGKIYNAPARTNIDIMPPDEETPLRPAVRVVQTHLPENDTAAAPEPEESVPFRLIGEAFDTYILLQQGEALYWIDKHAAHERILYEQLRKTADAQAQMLLDPVAVTVSKEEYNVLTEQMSLLRQAGFDLDDFGVGTLLVRGLPMNLCEQDAAAVLQEIAGRFLDGKREVTTEKLDWIYHSVACRAAVKAGDISQPQELLALAEQVMHDPQLRYCPHGRPICVQVSRREIEKLFGRIV